MSQTVTVQPGFASDPLPVAPFAVVTVNPTSSASLVYTQDPFNAILNNIANWAAWPSGTVTAPAANMANGQMFVRLSANTAPASVTISDPAPQVFELVPSPWVGVMAGSMVFSSTVTVQGNILVANGGSTSPSFSYISEPSSGWYRVSNQVFAHAITGTNRIALRPTGLIVSSSGSYSWGSGNDAAGPIGLVLAYDAANIMAQRNGAAAQEFRVYGSTAAFLSLAHNGTSAVVSTGGIGGLSLSASTMGFFSVAATTRPSVSTAIATTAATSVVPFGFATAQQAQDTMNAVRFLQQAMQQLGLST